MSYCPSCGKESPEGDLFCLSCGTRIALSEDNVTQEAAMSSDTLEAEEDAQTPIAEMVDEDPMQQDKEPSEMTVLPVDAQLPLDKPSDLASDTKTLKRTYTFRNTGVGLIAVGVLLIAAASLPLLLNLLPDLMRNSDFLIFQASVYAMIAIAVTVSTRAKGPDLSIGSMMAAAAIVCTMVYNAGNSLALAIPVSIAFCAVIGLISGALISYLKIPAVILTLLTGILIRQIITWMMMEIYTIRSVIINDLSLWAAIAGAAVLVTMALFAFFSSLGVPIFKRNNESGRKTKALAYMASAMIAAIAGTFLLLLAQGPAHMIGVGYEGYILFVFAVLVSSRILDNRVAPVLFCLLPAGIWTMVSFAFGMYVSDFTIQSVIGGGIALIMLIVAYIGRYEKRKKAAVGSMPMINIERAQS